MAIAAILKRMIMRGGFTWWSIFPNLMLISDPGLCMIQKWEGLRLQSYQDSRGIWTIGYGHTHLVSPHQTITQKQADQFLMQDVSLTERDVLNCLKVDLNKNEFSSLVCFTFNVGVQNFKTSTLLKLINRNQKKFAAQEFLKWDKIEISKGIFIPSLGLLNRRKEERSLFLLPIPTDLKSRSQ